MLKKNQVFVSTLSGEICAFSFIPAETTMEEIKRKYIETLPTTSTDSTDAVVRVTLDNRACEDSYVLKQSDNEKRVIVAFEFEKEVLHGKEKAKTGFLTAIIEFFSIIFKMIKDFLGANKIYKVVAIPINIANISDDELAILIGSTGEIVVEMLLDNECEDVLKRSTIARDDITSTTQTLSRHAHKIRNIMDYDTTTTTDAKEITLYKNILAYILFVAVRYAREYPAEGGMEGILDDMKCTPNEKALLVEMGLKLAPVREDSSQHLLSGSLLVEDDLQTIATLHNKQLEDNKPGTEPENR